MSMQSDLRERIAAALYEDGWPDGPPFTASALTVCDRYRQKADAVMRVVGPKIEELRETIRELSTHGLPDDLVAVLRDPTVTIPRDHEVKLADRRSLFEHINDWRNAPSDT